MPVFFACFLYESYPMDSAAAFMSTKTDGPQCQSQTHTPYNASNRSGVQDPTLCLFADICSCLIYFWLIVIFYCLLDRRLGRNSDYLEKTLAHRLDGAMPQKFNQRV